MSVETPTHEEIQIDEEENEEEEEVLDEDEEIDEEDEEGETTEVTHGRTKGRGLTLKILLKEGVLTPGDGTMTINYLGNKFKGNLLPDGRIRSQETNKVFGTPSAWAIYCKKIVNPDKKSGCGWASVRYRGKKLDSYKNNWYRQKRIEFEREGEAPDDEEMTDSESEGPHEQEIVEFELIGNRHPNHDMNTMVELTSFQALNRMQPFNVTMSSSAMAMINVHAHLTTSEVVGYLAGQWDVTNHNLIVSHAMPVRCRLGDGDKGRTVESSLITEMERLNLSLVGWYHTHPFSPPLPSLRDIDSQLEYELKMKGSNDASYTPCIGLIVSPYVRGGGQGSSSSGYWVMPPPEHKPLEYGRPMSIQFTIVQDAFMPKETLIHVRDTVKFYKDSPDAVVFSDIFQDRNTYWDKLRTALRLCVPRDHYSPLVDYMAKLLEFKNYVPEPIPTTPIKKPPPATPKPPPTPDLIPIEPVGPTCPPTAPVLQTMLDQNPSDNDNGTPRVATPENVNMEPEESPSKQPPVTEIQEIQENPESPEIEFLEESRVVPKMPDQPPHEPLIPSHQEYQIPPQISQQISQQMGQQIPQQIPQHPRGSPPPYRPPPIERLQQEQKQEPAAQQQQQVQPEIHQEHMSHSSYQEQQNYESQYQHYQQQQEQEQYHQQQYQQTQQQQQQQNQPQPQQTFPQQQQKQPEFQLEEEEAVKEYPREPPPSYHQPHFKIPASYSHEPKPPSYPSEESTPQEVSQGGVTEHGPTQFSESAPSEAWPSLTPGPQASQSEVREGEALQQMEVDPQV